MLHAQKQAIILRLKRQATSKLLSAEIQAYVADYLLEKVAK